MMSFLAFFLILSFMLESLNLLETNSHEVLTHTTNVLLSLIIKQLDKKMLIKWLVDIYNYFIVHVLWNLFPYRKNNIIITKAIIL